MSKPLYVVTHVPVMGRLAPVAFGLLLVGMVTGTLGDAAEPALVVSSADCRQWIDVELPADWQLPVANGYQLVDLAHPDRILPAQLTTGTRDDGQPSESMRRLVAGVPGVQGPGEPRQFRLRPAPSANDAGDRFHWDEVSDKTIRLTEGDRPVLAYNYGTITEPSVPETDPRRRSGCFVHPVWGLDGEVLTAAFPRDHYHHHGIFWTWKDVQVGGQHYDQWTDTKLRTHFVRWLGRETGPLAAVLGVENGWLVGSRQVMTERVWMRVFRSAGGDQMIDMQLTFIPTGDPVSLGGDQVKSYGGFTVRLDVWPRTDGVVRAAEQTTKDSQRTGLASSRDLVNVRLPWADLTSTFPAMDHRSGLAVLVSPRHPDYPPTWLTRSYGALCVGWPGVHSKTLQPGKPVTLRYRVWIHNRELPAQQLARQYRAYVASTQATWREGPTEP